MTSETLWTARRLLEMWISSACWGEDTAPEEEALAEIVKAIEATP